MSDKEHTDHDEITSETDRVIDPLPRTNHPNNSNDEDKEKNEKEISMSTRHSSNSRTSEYEEDETITDNSEKKVSRYRGNLKRLSEVVDSVDVDTKRTVAHGMMDTALISANANQLKFVIQFYEGAMLYSMTFLIVFSLLIQVMVGIALIFRHRKRKRAQQDDEDDNQKITVDEITIIGVFFVIIINIFISSFSGNSIPSSNTEFQNHTIHSTIKSTNNTE